MTPIADSVRELENRLLSYREVLQTLERIHAASMLAHDLSRRGPGGSWAYAYALGMIWTITSDSLKFLHEHGIQTEAVSLEESEQQLQVFRRELHAQFSPGAVLPTP